MSSLPESEDDILRVNKSKPLFEPSTFDVFENDWDAPPSGSTESSPASSAPVHSPFLERLESFGFSESAAPLIAPESPSRRNVVHLPGDSLCNDTDPLDEAAPMAIEHGDEIEWGRRLEEQQRLPSTAHPFFGHSFGRFHDIASELFPSPFQTRLFPGSPSSLRFPPTRSLLFSPPEPEDVPLPESPEAQLLYVSGGGQVPSAICEEENRIRNLHMQMVAQEAQSRNREAMLTEYIAKLNTMTRPPEPTPVPVHRPKQQDDVLVTDDGFYEYREDAPVPPSSSATVASDLPPSRTEQEEHLLNIEFLQHRQREIHTAVTMRATERRIRKRAKERAKELEALLQLKARAMYADAWDRAMSPRTRKQTCDEPQVISASGSDPHPGVNSRMVERHERQQRGKKRRRSGERHGEIMQLVAKMIFRRRDSLRPLNSKSIRTQGQPYVRSGLSRELCDGTETGTMPAEEEGTKAEYDFDDLLENGLMLC